MVQALHSLAVLVDYWPNGCVARPVILHLNFPLDLAHPVTVNLTLLLRISFLPVLQSGQTNHQVEKIEKN